MKRETLKKQYGFLKENIQMILLVPTAIGGLWQLLELAWISTSMISFFSLTQMIADGLLVLFFFSLLYIAFLIGRAPVGKIPKDRFKRNPKAYEKNWKSILVVSLLIILFSSIIFYFISFPLFKVIFKSELLYVGGIFLAILISYVIFVAVFGALHDLYLLLKIVFEKLRNDKLRKALGALLENLFVPFVKLIGIACVLLLLVVFISRFRGTYLVPNSLINMNNLEKKIKNYHTKPIDSSKVVYFNDRFFFFRIYPNDGKKDILVVPFEDILSQSSE